MPFEETSVITARDLIGKTLETRLGDKFTISGTKAYLGDSKQTKNKGIYENGQIMMFNMRGYLHTCVSTGDDEDRDYVLIHKLIDGTDKITSASKVSEILGMQMQDDGENYEAFFTVYGATNESTMNGNDDASTCIAEFNL